MRFSSARLAEILAAFSRSKILVIGDLMLDEFLWGKVTRISPEAPVPVVDIGGGHRRGRTGPASHPTFDR
jgi:bifunctional ADP-heptose synthase (sugar kinase/adenylyltransferase)